MKHDPALIKAHADTRAAIDAANREMMAAHYATLDAAARRMSAKVAEIEAIRHGILASRSFNSPSVADHHQRMADLNKVRLEVLAELGA